MRWRIRGGRVVDPASGRDGVADVVLEDGRIVEAAAGGPPEEVFDASGMLVFPGFIDLHVHLREPGFEFKETIATGAAAAAAGGFSAVCAMANTDPVNDHRSVTRWILDRGREAGGARVHPVGAITRGLAGRELAEFGEMKDAGAVAVSDDGHWVSDASLMRTALTYARLFDLPVATHAEDTSLSRRGAMHEGAVATRLGLSAQPAEAESIAVARDVALAELTGGRLHVCHVSTRQSLEIVRAARRRGVRVTCEATPHHLFLLDEEVAAANFSTNAKVNPPLRSREHAEALAEALADGTVDAVATDHAPHHADEKAADFEAAPFGMVGLETAAALFYTRLVAPGILAPSRMAELFSRGPAGAFSLPGGSLSASAPGDVTVFDPAAVWEVDPRLFRSRGRNTPFAGARLTGRVAATFVGGAPVFRAS